MLVIDKIKLREWLESLQKDSQVIVPQKNNGQNVLAPLNKEFKLILGYNFIAA